MGSNTGHAAPWRCVRPDTDVAQAWLAPLRLLPSEREHGTSCWEQTLASRLELSHVVVEYTPDVPEAVARHFAEAIELALAVEIDELGWRSPPGFDAYPLTVFVNNADAAGALTTLQPCGDQQLPVIAASLDAVADPELASAVAAHEVHHAIQLAYGQSAAFWFWEASATWMEAMVVPSTSWLEFVDVWARRPELGLERGQRADPQDLLHMYGRAIWLRHLEEHHGGAEVVRSLWEAADIEDASRFSLGQRALFEAAGLSLDDAMEDFAYRVALRMFRGGESYPVVTSSVLVGPGDDGAQAVDPLGQHHIVLPAASDAYVAYELTLDVADPAEWFVHVLVDGEVTKWPLGATESLVLEPWSRVSVIRRDDAVADPMLAWSLEGVPPQAGCGCSAGGGRPMLWWVSLIGWIVVRRRVAMRRPRW